MPKELSNLKKPLGATSKKSRVGRGVGSGIGKTSGRGQKGQFARTGRFKPHFEGGQTPIQRRLPKRGFTKPNRAIVAEVNVGQLEVFAAGASVDEAALRAHGIVKGACDKLKILGSGDITKKLVVTAHAFSKSAAQKIEKAGGKTQFAGAAGAKAS